MPHLTWDSASLSLRLNPRKVALPIVLRSLSLCQPESTCFSVLQHNHCPDFPFLTLSPDFLYFTACTDFPLYYPMKSKLLFACFA